VEGGGGDASGSVICLGPMKSLRVKGSLTSGGGEWSGSVYAAGAAGAIRSLRVDGSVVGGTHAFTGIVVGRTLGKLTVGADVRGAALPVRILAGGEPEPSSEKAAVAIGSVKVGARVEAAEILAGWDAGRNPVNADVQIGKVLVSGDWVASTLAAGTDPGTLSFGDADDRPIAEGGSAAIRSRIGSVTVRGAVSGTATAGDHFGFVAAEIGAFRVGGRRLALAKGAGNDDPAAADPEFLLGADGDVRVRELPLD
jgi:hypothetical protein